MINDTNTNTTDTTDTNTGVAGYYGVIQCEFGEFGESNVVFRLSIVYFYFCVCFGLSFEEKKKWFECVVACTREVFATRA